MRITGRAIKYGDNINTDVIIPARYLTSTDPTKLAEHAMEGVDPDFASKAKGGKILVAGRNFGCGSSREHAPLALKASGIRAVVADSFARIFFRNAINIGLVVVECKGVSRSVEEGDILEVDLELGMVVNSSKGTSLPSTQYPEAVLKITEKGGLMEYLRDKIAGG
jgi:3-isopropylmalate/(R)-2-methylmalate dehydratase small subunit